MAGNPDRGRQAGRSSLVQWLDSLSTRKSGAAYRGTLAATVPGVRPTDRTAADRYQVQPGYQRYDQKLNMTRRGLWQPEAYPPESNLMVNRSRLVQAGKPGYSILDWGFANAGWAGHRLTGFGVNVPDQGPTSWSPLGDPAPEGTAGWASDPATNARLVKKVARIFGAGDVGITVLDRRWVYGRWFDERTGRSFPIRFSDEAGYEGITSPCQLEDHTQVIPAGMKYIAVFVLPMPRQGIRSAPTLTQLAATLVTYSEIGRFVAAIAEFIRALGYHAIPSSNCTALSIPLAVDAGLGELARNAKLIHPVWGPICRLC